jgi:hypothetical protein
MGTGRRVARLTQQLRAGHEADLADRLRLGFVIAQDRDHVVVDLVQDLCRPHLDVIDPVIFDVSEEEVVRCIACDICPTEVGPDHEYRCIITREDDFFRRMHGSLWDLDALVPSGLSARDPQGVNSRYQQFMERTRYLRRGDYVFTDLVTAPLVVHEVGAHDSLQLRMLTSTIRHHTVLARPVTAYLDNNVILNLDDVRTEFAGFIENARRVLVGRLATHNDGSGSHVKYNPVGYVLSAEKEQDDEQLGARARSVRTRESRESNMAEKRLKPVAPKTIA